VVNNPNDGEGVGRLGRTGTLQPLGTEGVARRDDGVLAYTNRPASLIEMLRLSVDRFPGKGALVEVGGERVTYRELWDRAAQVAGGLAGAGVRPGDRVGIRYLNGIPWCLGFFGTLMAGAVAVPINMRFAAPEVEYVLKDADVSYVFEAGSPLPSGGPVVVESDDSSRLAALFYTSGTTGFPKGAMTSHENLLATSETFQRQAGGPGPDIRHLISVPLFHVTGCNSQLIPTLEMGGTSILLPQFSVGAFIAAIQEERINMLVAVPSIYWLAMQQADFATLDVSAVRLVGYGGAPTSPDLVAQIANAFPGARLVNGYGLTETAATSTSLPHEYSKLRPESVGLAIPIVELDLADVDPASDVGELLIRGQNVTSGYWRNPAATSAAYVDGWFHTGDLARIDDEGFVVIVDRRKDMINRGGENVYCVEVENAIAGHPAVYESAVLAVSDKMLGEAVGAVVVPKPGQTIDPFELRSFLAGQIADFKIPQYISLQTELLPRNAGGKVLKPVLRDQTVWSTERLR
jgi:long-chain acyl-CoA synthetase